MGHNWTIKKLFEEILQIESKYKLFDKEIDGIYLWKLLRYNVFIEVSQKLKLIEDPHPTPKRHINRYVWLVKHFINGTFNGPLTGNNNAEIILFPHPRKVTTEEHELIDIYSDYLEKKWQKENTHYLVIEKPYNEVFLRKASKMVRHNETLSLFTLLHYFTPKENMYFTIDGLDSIANIPICDIDALSEENISKTIHTFKREYHYYTKVLRKHKPKKIYMVVADFRHALLAAADDLKIETIEIQHGQISPFGVGFNYPMHTKIPYFPKKLILWGKFWYDNAQMPLGEEYVSYEGFPFFDKEIKKYANVVQDNTRVLFISQGQIGRLLVDIAIEFSEKNKEYKVVYRLHPSEVEQWKTLYPKLYISSMENDNISVETGKINPLHKSLTNSKFVVGVNSTALFESLAMNCKLVIIDLPGVEYFQVLIDKKLVQKVKNADQLVKKIKEDNQQMHIDRNYFFKEYKAE